MALSSQPIAVASKQAQDFSPAYSPFSPANFFAGSPMSFKTGSFQNRFYPGGSPGQLLGPIAVPDLKRGLAGSWDNETGAWLKAVKNSDAAIEEDELCRNYVCCGVALPDLHALVDHFESHHVEVFCSPYDDPVPYPDDDSTAGGTPAFDADDMEISEPSPSPPATPSPIMQSSAFDPIRVSGSSIATSSDGAARVSAFFRGAAPHQYHSSYSSLAGANGVGVSGLLHHQHNQSTPGPSAFNRYVGYSDYSSNLPGTDPCPAYVMDAQKDLPHHHLNFDMSAPMGAASSGTAAMTAARCVPPALLFSSSASPSPLNTPTSSRTSSPALSTATSYGLHAPDTTSTGTLTLHPSGSGSNAGASFRGATASSSSSRSSGSGSGSGATLMLSKPFRCPKPGCNKSYKQQNGLKYHLSHGQCNFAPRDPEVEKLSEVERDKRLRPFVCKVGTECNRRYKNMNGLRYHYTHTGEHGAIGLEMLAQGRHPLPDIPNSSRASSAQPKASSHSSPQQHHMQHQHQYQHPHPGATLGGLSASTSTSTSPASSLASSSPSSLASMGYFPGQQQQQQQSQLQQHVAMPMPMPAMPVGGIPQAMAMRMGPGAPMGLVMPHADQSQSQGQSQSPAPSPMNPFPPHGHGWLLGSD